MTRPAPGLQCFHNGRPVECLWKVRDYADGRDAGEVWLVKPLFIERAVNREELFRPGDRLTPLHTQYPRKSQ